ncbi:MAG TPA: PLP-dependent aminotransferase family protein [Ramlibacter sp.]|nr:PLP-dependent aminotransferase family protein [Ramlibacter sp.]
MPRRASTYELSLTPQAGPTGAAGFYAQLRQAILEGRLRPGARLPSTRQMALDHGVARGTVVAAFEQLLAEGYLQARQGSGTRVSEVLPDALLAAVSGGAREAAVQRPIAASLSSRGATLAQTPFGSATGLRPGTPFAPHLPALQEFPVRLWATIAARQARALSPAVLADADPRGQPLLRAAIADYLAGTRGVRCTGDQAIVLASVQQAVDLAARLLLEAGDGCWFEDPGYAGARAALQAAGAQVQPVPVDDDGLDVALAQQRWPHARMAYVTPAHQAPLGMALSLPRRLALLDWARRRGAWIFEDDYDSEYRYFDKPLPALQSLDPQGPVLYAGCFSKTLFPGLRIAYLVVPQALVDAFAAARSVTSRYAPVLDQLVLAEFMREGHYARHLRRMRQLYAQRRQLLVEQLERRTAGVLEVLDNPTGLNLACWLAAGWTEARAVERCAQAGLRVQPLGAYAIERARQRRAGLLLGFASLTPSMIRVASEKLGRALGSP